MKRVTSSAWGIACALACVGALGATASGEAVTTAPHAIPLAAAASTFVPSPSYESPCPEGLSRSSTVYAQSFNNIPESRYNTGFFPTAGGTKGANAARSYVSSSGGAEHMFLPYQRVPSPARTMLGFTTKGSTGARARVAVNSVRTNFSTSSSYRGVSIDVTDATRDESGWLSTYFEHRSTSGVATQLLIDQAELYRCSDNETSRISGSDRYATAAKVSESVSAPTATVYVASGLTFPDALSAAALAGSTGAPILLVSTNSVPSATKTALERLDPSRIVVLGGTRAVTSSVQRSLEAYAPSVERLGGGDRYETSALISGQFDPGVSTAFVATGTNFPDALSGGALAAAQDSPMLLVGHTSIPDSIRTELERLRPRRIVVLGGSASVRNIVESDLQNYTTGSVRRIDGDDRYEASANVAAEFDAPRSSYLATGEGFADAITGGAVAGAAGAPLLLTRYLDLPTSVERRLSAMDERSGMVLGGTSSVDPIVRDQYGRTLP